MSSIHPTTGRRISLRNTRNQESPTTTTRWEDLPEECWELVFDRLKYHHYYHDQNRDRDRHRPYRHFESVSLVCKQFLSISNRLRSSLNIIDPLIPCKSSNFSYLNHLLPHYQNTHSVLLRRFPHLNRINLVEFHGDLDLILAELAQSGLNLQALDISNQKKFPEKGLKELGGSKMNKSLKILICARLYDCLLDKHLMVIADALPYLEELDISSPREEKHYFNPKHITDEGIENLSSKLPYLRKIDIAGITLISSLSLLSISSNCVFLTHITAANFIFLMRNDAIRSLIYNCRHLISLTVVGERSLTPIHPETLPAYIPPTAIIESSLVTSSKDLSVLDFSQMIISDEFLFSVREADLPLKKLALSHCRGEFTINGIDSILCAYHRSLKHLDLRGTDFLTDQSISDLSKYNMHDLNFIGLDSCSQLTNSTFFTLASNCLSLQEIRMQSTSLGKGGCPTKLFLGKKNLAIRVLKFAKNLRLNDKTLEKIGIVCPKLESLDVSRCLNITEHEIGKRCSEIRELKFIRSMRICDFLVTPNSSEFSKLEVLMATQTRIKDKALSRVGCYCIGLQRLVLAGCVGVTEKGMEEVVKKCKSLRELNLIGCRKTTDAFLRSIALSCPLLREICPCPLLREICPPGGFISYKKRRDWFLRHGCMVYEGRDWHY